MSMSSLDTPAELPPLERLGQIEVDSFCTGCFYNLHGQVVSIDARLGFRFADVPNAADSSPPARV